MILREPNRLPNRYLIYYRAGNREIGIEIPSDIYRAGTTAARKHVSRFKLLPERGWWVPTGIMAGEVVSFNTPTKYLVPGDIWRDTDGSGEAMLIGGYVEFKRGELIREQSGRISASKENPRFTLSEGDFRLKK